jgi:hypothetical protein
MRGPTDRLGETARKHREGFIRGDLFLNCCSIVAIPEAVPYVNSGTSRGSVPAIRRISKRRKDRHQRHGGLHQLHTYRMAWS